MNQTNPFEQLIEEPQQTGRAEQRLIDDYLNTYCKEGQTPLGQSGIFSRLFFNWMTPILRLGNRTVFQKEYQYNLRNIDQAENNYSRIKEQWEKIYPNWSHEPGTKVSPFMIVKLLVKTYPWMFFIFNTFTLCLSVITFFNIKLLQIILEKLEDEEMKNMGFVDKLKRVSVLVLLLIFSKTSVMILTQQNDFIKKLMEMRVNYSLISLIFHKVLNKSMLRDPTYTIGEVTNISKSDSFMVCLMVWWVTEMVIIPAYIIFAIIWLYFIVGNVIVIPLLSFLVIAYLNYKISKISYTYQANFLENKDLRGKLVSEIFTNIRYIKMMGLENYFITKVARRKDEEVKWLKLDFNRVIKLRMLSQVTPQIFLFLLYGSYIWSSGMFTISFLFTTLMIGDLFRENFQKVPMMLNWYNGFLVSCERIGVFLLSDNINNAYIEHDVEGDEDEEHAIEIQSGTFYWEDEELNKLYLKAKQRVTKTDEPEETPDTARDSESSHNFFRSTQEEREKKAKLRAKISSQGHLVENRSKDARFGEMRTNGNVMELIETEEDVEVVDTEFDNFSLHENLYEGIKFNLKDINIKVKKGACVGVIGGVGSEKSSLLSCLSGEMHHKLGARIKISGSTAYVSQRAWIPSMTVKESILFGAEEFDQERYQEAIKYSCMADDLRILANRDETMLGENGINLSGGQKIRLSIARALYSDSDIYLFDDPISALDVHVGKAVMEEGIVGYLKGKTRIVATHAIAFLKYFDYIYVLDDGRVVEEGDYEYISGTEVFKRIKAAEKKQNDKQKEETPEELDIGEEDQDDNKGYDDLIFEDSQQQSDDEDDGDQKYRIENMTYNKKDKKAILKRRKTSKQKRYHPSSLNDLVSNPNKSRINDISDIADHSQRKLIEGIIQSEDRVEGNISFEVLKNWIMLSGGPSYFLMVFVAMTVVSIAEAGSLWFMQYLASDKLIRNNSKLYQFSCFFAPYLGIVLILMLGKLLKLVLIFHGNIKMSLEMNFRMTFKTIHASVNKYFDRVPMGRILNRFIADVQVLDYELPWSTEIVLMSAFVCLTAFSVTSVTSSVWTIFVMMLYVYLSFKLQRYYMQVSRELTRLESISTSPVIQKFKEGLNGVLTIRFFKKRGYQFSGYFEKVDQFQRNSIAVRGAKNWFIIRVSLLTLMVIIPTVCIALFISNKSLGMFGLLLHYVLQITENINTLLNCCGDHENKMIALERCCALMNVNPEVGYKDLDKLEKALRKGEDVVAKKKESWPKKGRIVIKNLSIRYRRGLPYVLNNLTLRIRSGSKVGIVGRTGAGKTTLITALYRTFQDYKGQILIDGVEIRKLDLKVLRQGMTIIPQDPYLFEDTLRNNIDPMKDFTDEEIQAILKDVDLWKKFAMLDGLTTKIEKEGSNLSQGEKQLVCLARALLFKKKLVLMDEATSNIDVKTEKTIQSLIKERFVDSTVLVIAHRLNTILHCDKVLVLEQGEILEYDDLENLRGNPKSHFGRMLMKSDEIQKSLT